MDILGIARAQFDVALLIGALLIGERARHSTVSNTQAGFEPLLVWLARHRRTPDAPRTHPCTPAWKPPAIGAWTWQPVCTAGNQVSIVNLGRTFWFGPAHQSLGRELARTKTDKLDAALTARFCRPHPARMDAASPAPARASRTGPPLRRPQSHARPAAEPQDRRFRLAHSRRLHHSPHRRARSADQRPSWTPCAASSLPTRS